MPGFGANGSVKSLEIEVTNVTLAYFMIPEVQKKKDTAPSFTGVITLWTLCDPITMMKPPHEVLTKE